MSKRTVKPNRIVEHGAGWHIEYSPMDKEFIGVMNEVGPVSRGQTKDDARFDLLDMMCDEHAINAAVATATEMDGGIDENGDIDFSNDEPTINAQLAAKGMRRADGERDAFVNVVEFGRVTQVWACKADQPREPRPRQFFSYREAKAR